MKNKINHLLHAVATVYDRRKSTNLVKAFLAAFLCAFSTSGFGAELKIATVDMRKVFEAYHKTAEANMAITNEAAEVEKGLKAMMADEDKAKEAGKQAFDRASDMSISAEEREKSKAASQDKAIEIQKMQTEIERYNAREQEELGTKRGQRISSIVKEIREVLNAMAVARGFDMVLDKSGETSPGVPVLLYTNGANDLTEALIKQLNAGALPLPGADSKTPDSKPTK
jgi:Skp family chaperone for outer membrane proteins